MAVPLGLAGRTPVRQLELHSAEGQDTMEVAAVQLGH